MYKFIIMYINALIIEGIVDELVEDAVDLVQKILKAKIFFFRGFESHHGVRFIIL
jgi:hypothetical protein